MELSFLDPKLISRIERSPLEKDLLRTALGKGPHNILDATAGFCKDSLRMAYWGHAVWACERDKKLRTLVSKALLEIQNHDFYSPWIARLNYFPLSTEDYLNSHPEMDFDIIVIDSMFPDEKRKGLPKKDLQNIKAIVSDDSDNAAELLSFCYHFPWNQKPKKILVKRPLKAPTIENFRISFSYKGRSHRWDLYLP